MSICGITVNDDDANVAADSGVGFFKAFVWDGKASLDLLLDTG